jgi:hypothetical protein
MALTCDKEKREESFSPDLVYVNHNVTKLGWGVSGF